MDGCYSREVAARQTRLSRINLNVTLAIESGLCYSLRVADEQYVAVEHPGGPDQDLKGLPR